jgi:hypothetical protein
MAEFGVRFRGVGEAVTRLTEMELGSEVGTRQALNKSTSYTKNRIRGGMRGAARWGHKGPDKATGAPAVSTGRSPDHRPRNGGPGQLTGNLYRSIRKSRKPRSEGPGAYSQVVISGGRGGYQNRYKKTIEKEYPYFEPGVNKAKPRVHEFFRAAWETAVFMKGAGR